MLMAYEVCDSLLRRGGRLGFVITQSVLKTSGAGQGFRRLELSTGEHLAVRHVDDLVDLQPFEAATNRTAVVVLEKGTRTSYPVPYTIWQKKVKGKRVGYDSTLPEVWDLTRRLNYFAEPVDTSDKTSAWLTARRKALRALRKMSGRSDYEAHEGVNTGGANGVYWVTEIQGRKDGTVLVQNLTEGAKRKVDTIQAMLESDHLFPLVRGRDVERWKFLPSAKLLMVQDVATRRGISEAVLQADYPKTWAYLKHFESDLRARAAFKRFFTRKQGGRTVETGPFYSMFDVGEYTLAQWKVAWREIASEFTCSVLAPPKDGNGRIPIPSHKLMIVGCQGRGEAHYLCAVLNSVCCRLFAKAYMVETQLSTHVVQNIKIPKYSGSDKAHCALSDLSLQAHVLRQQDKPVEEVEQEINRLAAKLWSVGKEELEDIEYCYKELMKADIGTPRGAEADQAEEDEEEET